MFPEDSAADEKPRVVNVVRFVSAKVECRFHPHLAHCVLNPRCTMTQWLVFSPPSSAMNLTNAQFLMLRVHAAKIANSQYGLIPLKNSLILALLFMLSL
jgi:hypothetical protein